MTPQQSQQADLNVERMSYGEVPPKPVLKDLGSPAANAVRDFHIAFDHPYHERLHVPSFATRVLRVKLLLEEVVELAQASGVKVIATLEAPNGVYEHYDSNTANKDRVDLVQAADALGDIEYVLHGAAHCWGIPLQTVFDEVHRSNMAKLGPDGKPIYRESDRKVLKPEGWTPPDIRGVLRSYYYSTSQHGGGL